MSTLALARCFKNRNTDDLDYKRNGYTGKWGVKQCFANVWSSKKERDTHISMRAWSNQWYSRYIAYFVLIV